MTDTILVAIITGAFSIVGVLIANRKNAFAMDAKLDKQQAVMETKLEVLTDEVRKHNNFAERVPVIEEKIGVANKRIADLEAKLS